MQIDLKALNDETLIRKYRALNEELDAIKLTDNDRLEQAIVISEQMTQIDYELKRRYPA